MPANKITFLAVLIIIFSAACVYLNSLSGDFVWDDCLLIRDNDSINSWNIKSIFFADRNTLSPGMYVSYRPLESLSYLFSYKLWQLNPGGYHFVSLVLHILVGVFIFLFVGLVFSDYLLSFLAALFFVVHPAHTESVSYISARAEPLAFLFILLSFIFYLSCRKRNSAFVYAGIFILSSLAFLSKESALILPVLVILWHLVFKESIKPIKILLMFLAGAIFIFIRQKATGSFLPSGTSLAVVLERIPGFFSAFSGYIRILFFPKDLHMEYGIAHFSILSYEALLGLAEFIFLIFIMYKYRWNKIIFFCLGWFMCALIPVANIIPFNATYYMAEHWLYVPSLGFFILLAYCICRLKTNYRILALSAALIVFCVSAYLTFKQNTYWKDEIFFYNTTLKYNPQSARVWYNLGNSYSSRDDYKNAVQAYQQAIRLKPDYTQACYNLALVYYWQKEFSLAKKYFLEAKKLGHLGRIDSLLQGYKAK
ncbi:MAG: tetratricopeptide repeat protein [Candidatus Omnitrophica bacterium]|jgi:tetratricopeptide (TPR) repeat protein|nr:tetratricopeptide repeat protein [Candidatus Omnitrophota bacterium]